MIKWMLGFFFMVFILGLALDVFGQTTTIVLDAEGNYKGQLITYPPIPQWR